MGRFLFYGGLLVIMVNAGCKSYSKFTIDQKAVNKIDTHLLGIWKVVEDTDKANFILVQSNYEAWERDKYDQSTYIPTYPNYKEVKDCMYFLTYFNYHGQSALYHQWHAFTSNVGNFNFLNMTYWHTPVGISENGDSVWKNGEETEGFLIVRLIEINSMHNKVTTAIVADTTMKYLKSSVEVRSRIQKNLNNRKFYSDTMHLYKVSDYHATLAEAINKAN